MRSVLHQDGTFAARIMEQDTMKRTILFTTALATAVGMFALGAAQASGKSDKGEVRNAYETSNLYLSGEGSEYQVRNKHQERTEYQERNKYQEHNGYGDSDDSDDSDEGSDD